MSTLGFGDAVLPYLVEQSFVADLQDRCSLLAVPVRLLERLRDGYCFSFVFGCARQRLQSTRIAASRGRVALYATVAIQLAVGVR